ncbi:hypothetical protein LSH36_605g02002 [Paralvinella palmiformis]|uniref:EF-hand domain-containing protein n=1 Tax=Paralvinella palmiformis TaxID=53620 RepID=A0AAD9MXD1_9ANNE|nr:hypothetical protein LSH36_605g02002 [Paralvinella palmiformis]
MSEKNSEEGKENAENLTDEIGRKIADAFDVFDHDSNKTVDVREIPNIIRSLGCCPSEAEMQDIILEIDEDDSNGYIRYEKFRPIMTKILMERKYRPATEDRILKAFQVLDTDNKAYLTQDELKEYMTKEGDAFNQDEMDEMLSAAVDPEKGYILYKEYAALMTVEDT